jgi:hypothetical protein
MRLPISAIVPAIVLATASLPAQAIAGSFSPNPVAPGVPVTLTCTDSTGLGLNLSSPCGWFDIFQGSQTGPQVQLGLFCQQVIVPVPPNGTFQFTWNQQDMNGRQVPPGRYWFQVRAWDGSFSAQVTDWFCISIQPAGVPALTAAGPARLNTTTALQIAAPAEPGAVYIAAASFSSNNPVSFLGLDTCLSLPAFLDLLVAPIGALDGSGNSSGLGLQIPNAPIALWFGLHVQALIVGNAGLQLTNDLSFTIQP